eukprot:4673762-Lingulodinium_polyedra.AAC.1
MPFGANRWGPKDGFSPCGPPVPARLASNSPTLLRKRPGGYYQRATTKGVREDAGYCKPGEASNKGATTIGATWQDGGRHASARQRATHRPPGGYASAGGSRA